MKPMNKILSLLLATMIVALSLTPCTLGAEPSTPKEEVVYINLKPDGTVREIYVVNIFDLDSNGRIVDYGAYESLRNMTSTDAIGYSDGQVTIDAKAGKLYYEGKLSSRVMPWNISVRYYLDGVEYSAEEIAGKSGALRISMTITENEECRGDFFAGYALQATIALDSRRCSDILAQGATVANVGAKKQMTYTILPGRGAEIDLSAQVVDFEMEAISLNGVRLNLDLDFNLEDAELWSQIETLIGAVSELNFGAQSLNVGTDKIYNASTLLADKTFEAATGVGAIAAGAEKLSNGLSAITKNNQTLLSGAEQTFEAICSAGALALNAELAANGLPTVTLTPGNYASVLTGLLSQMQADAVYAAAYNQALAEVKKRVDAEADALYRGYVEQNADSIYRTYLDSIRDTLYETAVKQVLTERLIASGFPSAQVESYLATESGQEKIDRAILALTAQQKSEIVTSAASSLTQEQKSQIREGALGAMTADQKAQIRQGFIDQTMKSKEVTDRITAAVREANSAAAGVAELKGQLDNYSLFCEGLEEYTAAVSDAANGAKDLAEGLDALESGMDELQSGVRSLSEGVGSLLDATGTLKDGTGAFAEQTTGIDSAVSEGIRDLVSSASGSDVETVSFVSEMNTEVDGVQFVIRTEAIEVPEAELDEPAPEVKLTFWQKLLRLFGLY